MQLNEAVKILPGVATSVEKRLEDYRQKNPSETLIHLDRTGMTGAMPKEVVQGLEEAVQDMASPFGTHLDSPAYGYPSVRAAVTALLGELNTGIMESEVFLCAGLESASGAFSRLFTPENDVVLSDPGEPNLATLHRSVGRNVRFMRAVPENGFLPMPGEPADLICLASPNPVTGAVYSAEQLTAWVEHANENGSILIFDASFSAYNPEGVRSIYQIPGSKNCAVELFAFDRAFGEPEMKVASIVIPQTLEREGARLNALFAAQASSVTTPPSFVSQRGAEKYISQEERSAREELFQGIGEVSAILSQGLTAMGIPHVGEGKSPYLWAQCPEGQSAWQFFDQMLEEARVVVTPGSLFGYGGEHFFRLSAYATAQEAREAVEAMAKVLEKPREEEEAQPAAAEVIFDEPV